MAGLAEGDVGATAVAEAEGDTLLGAAALGRMTGGGGRVAVAAALPVEESQAEAEPAGGA